ncbi:MAG: hypothetical protein HKM24_07070 [Gammaproteobacteria bacterium]|nr:hypothetical protein [Gammaproteobacteria bacterium]
MTKQVLPIVFLLITTPVMAQVAPDTRIDRIVAVVNTGVVLQSEFDYQLKDTESALRRQRITVPPTAIFKEQVLEQLVLQELQLQRAQQLGINIPDSSVDQMLSRVAERNNLTLAQLPVELQRDGVNFEEYRQQVREQLIIEQLRYRDVGARIDISRSEVEALAIGNDDGQEYEIAHILLTVPTDSDQETIGEIEANANRLFDAIQNDGDFTSLASEYSSAHDATSGGYLGWRTLSNMPSVFAQPVQTLADNETHPPIRSRNGFHLLKLIAKRETTLDDTRLNDAYLALQEQKIAQQSETWLRRLRDDAYVDIRL